MADSDQTPGHRITSVWLFVAIDGDEGIPAFMSSTGMMPMVCSDLARVGQLRAVAETLVDFLPGQRIELRRFDGPCVVEDVIEP